MKNTVYDVEVCVRWIFVMMCCATKDLQTTISTDLLIVHSPPTLSIYKTGKIIVAYYQLTAVRVA